MITHFRALEMSPQMVKQNRFGGTGRKESNCDDKSFFTKSNTCGWYWSAHYWALRWNYWESGT